MNETVITAIIGGVSGLIGAAAGWMAQRRAHYEKQNEAQLQHDLGLRDRLTATSDRLTALGQQTMDAASEHMKEVLALTIEKYKLEDRVKDLEELLKRSNDEINELGIECQKKEDAIVTLEIRVADLKEEVKAK